MKKTAKQKRVDQMNHDMLVATFPTLKRDEELTFEQAIQKLEAGQSTPGTAIQRVLLDDKLWKGEMGVDRAAGESWSVWSVCVGEMYERRIVGYGRTIMEAVRSVQRKLKGELPVDRLDSHCPECGEPAESQCRCFRSERTCRNGHSWHTCTVHHTVVRGPAPHDLDIQECTCKEQS